MNLMKAISFAICFLAMLGVRGVAHAQGDDDYVSWGLSYGAKVGMVVSELNNNQPHTGSRIGASAGGFAEFYFSDVIAVHSGVSYFQQGGTFTQFINNSRFGSDDNFLNNHVREAEVTLHTVHVPLQAKIMPFGTGNMPHLLIGGFADYIFDASEKFEKTGTVGGNIYTTATGTERVTDQYEPFHFGAIAGIQLELPFQGDMEWVINASYKYGITPVKQAHSYIDFNEVAEEMTNNAFLFSIGLKF